MKTYKLMLNPLSFYSSDNGAVIVQTYSFDFFNYAGIHRSVMLYTTPKIYIKDVKITTDIADNDGELKYLTKGNFQHGRAT